MTRPATPSRFTAPRRTLAGAAAALTVAPLAVVVTGAAAQSRLTVDASAGAGVSTNPYLGSGSTPATGLGTLDIRPLLTIERPLTTLELSGDANVAFYTRDYGTNESFALNGAIDHKLSERTTLKASIGFLDSIVGSYTDVRVPVGLPVVENDLPVYVNDPALGGVGQRRQSYQAAAGLGSMLSPRDRVAVNVSASANRFGGIAFADYNYFASSASYSRALGEKFNVGVLMSVGFSNYLGTRIGDATIYQPSLTLSREFGNRWTLDAAGGVAISTLRGADGRDSSSTTFNGTVNVCHRTDRWNACFGGSRQTLPSAYQGVRSQTSVTATVGYRASAKDSLSFVGSYSHAGDPLQQSVIGGIRSGAVDYVNATGNLSHRFARAFSGFVSGGYSKAFDNFLRRDANFTGQVGVSYRFGAR